MAMFTRRRELQPSSCTRGRFILLHCKSWIIERTEADCAGKLPRRRSAVQEGRASCTALGFSLFGPSPDGLALPSSWLDARAREIATPPPPHDPTPPRIPPPLTPPARFASPRGQPSSSSTGRASSSSQSPFACPGPGWYFSQGRWVPLETWQFWAGAMAGWVDYPPEISARLSAMHRDGPRRTEYAANGQSYILDVELMQQADVGSDRPPRRIRISADDIHVWMRSTPEHGRPSERGTS